MKTFLIPLFWLLPLPHETTIVGKVLDFDTKKPVEFVIVSAVDELKPFSLSDSNGTYKITVNGNPPMHLRFTELGYYSLDTLVFETHNPLIIYLRENPHAILGDNISTFNRETAEKDLIAGHVILFSYDKVKYSKRRKNFLERKYNLSIHSTKQALTSDQIQNINDYNDLMMKFLDKKYGKEWRNEFNNLK
jgi:hypothetical protein